MLPQCNGETHALEAIVSMPLYETYASNIAMDACVGEEDALDHERRLALGICPFDGHSDLGLNLQACDNESDCKVWHEIIKAGCHNPHEMT